LLTVPLTRRSLTLATGAAALAGLLGRGPALAQARLLEETVSFTGQILFLQTKVPALVIGAVRNGETFVTGFGETRPGSGKAPGGDTVMRIGSISKAFAGGVLASLAADGTVRLSDTLEKWLQWPVTIPERDGSLIRLVDLATHASGLPREAERKPGPPDNPFGTLTRDVYIANLKGDPLMFAPGRGAFYSNFGFDLLAQALAGAAGKPYPQLVAERITEPLGLKDTVLDLNDDQRARQMTGHGFDREPLPSVPSNPLMAGSGGLHSTPNDILRWLDWQLQRGGGHDPEARLVAQASYLRRDGISPVYGLDESGRMDALGLAWIVMHPEANRPLIMQKAGGLQGIFCYAAFAPTRNVGVFVAINAFDIGASMLMATVVNELIATLAPR